MIKTIVECDRCHKDITGEPAYNFSVAMYDEAFVLADLNVNVNTEEHYCKKCTSDIVRFARFGIIPKDEPAAAPEPETVAHDELKEAVMDAVQELIEETYDPGVIPSEEDSEDLTEDEEDALIAEKTPEDILWDKIGDKMKDVPDDALDDAVADVEKSMEKYPASNKKLKPNFIAGRSVDDIADMYVVRGMSAKKIAIECGVSASEMKTFIRMNHITRAGA